MIKKVKRKFILLSLSALLALLLVILTGMNVLNYKTVVREADQVLAMLSENNDRPPEFMSGFGGMDGFGMMGGPMSPEVPFESRFFSVVLDSSGAVVMTDTNQIISVDSALAKLYAKVVLEKGKDRGFVDDFRYVCSAGSFGTRITFLDCGRKLDAFYSFLLTSLIVAFLGYGVVAVCLTFFAGRIIRPIAESYEKQKRFITDAGHEIKTPLTIINANVDVLEMELGVGNECLSDIQTQTQRLTALTNDLVYLSRMEEQEDTLQMIEFPASDLVYETVASFKAPAQTQGKTFALDIRPMLTMKGNTKAVEKLVSVLMNNALKYSPDESVIRVSFTANGRQRVLTIENPSVDPVEKEKLNHAFDRFYRADTSRNSQTGGHGIGLSMAQAIVNAHGGQIKAWTRDGSTFGVTATFPE